jgi:G6PDH family F420-dependent oxidoreductase
MPEIGYTLSSEEHRPADLVEHARMAEDAGFSFALISDHFHPWVDKQGNSPFVWATLGGIASRTDRLRVGTGVTCPTTRIHPAIVAHAAATVASMMPGRFFLGVGSGENLNEHILGDRWPEIEVRQEMLEEAIEVIRLLWQGGFQSHHGRHYTVENARIYTLPEEPPPIMVASAGKKATSLAARVGDGLVGIAPQAEVIEQFDREGGKGKPRYGQVHVCWAESEEEGRRTVAEWWPNGGVPGNLFIELPLPSHFEEAAELVDAETATEGVPCGPDPDRFVEAVDEYVDAGFDHVYLHQVGPDQRGFFEFAKRELLPRLSEAGFELAAA